METTDWLIVGGGVVGLSVALEVKRRTPFSSVVLLEKESSFGVHSSGRNSGVIHAGVYYSPGSLKARIAREGNLKLTQYCLDRDIPVLQCGKLILAPEEDEQGDLDELLRRGRANGVPLEAVDEQQAAELDPKARTNGRALWSPSTSSVDPEMVMSSLVADARDAGVRLHLQEGFKGWRDGVVQTTKGRYSAGYVINAAGGYADIVARQFGFSRHHRIIPFKGRYLRAEVDTGVRRHLYPVPDLRYPFLGIHFTVAVDGTVWIGPTATPVLEKEQYGWAIHRPREAVRTAWRLAMLLTRRQNGGLRRLALREVKLHSHRAMLAEGAKLARDLPSAGNWKQGRPGIRAQLVDTREWKLEDDFVYAADDRSLHVLNAVSPGFTCALPLAEHLLDIIGRVRG